MQDTDVSHIYKFKCSGESESYSVVSNSLGPHWLYSPWNPPGQNTGVGNLSLLQGIFPTQGLNPGLPHCGQILYQLSHKGRPRILEWVAYPFSSQSSWPRNRIRSPALQADSLPAELPGKAKRGDSPVVQWLGSHPSPEGDMGSNPSQETPCKPCGAAKNKKFFNK